MPPAPDLPAGQLDGRLAQRGTWLRHPRHAGHPAPAAGHADQDVLAAVARRAPQCVRDRVVHGRTGRRASADPIGFRLTHLTDPRPRRVLTEAAYMAGWDTRGRRAGIGYGAGVARYSGVAGYCAAVAEVAADTDIRVRRLWLAVDVGRVINPDGVINQVEGGAVQSASWTLREQVRFDRDQITSAGWDSYPILRFTETPEVTVHIVDAPGEAEVGAGEVARGRWPAPSATRSPTRSGVRVRDLPLTHQGVGGSNPLSPTISNQVLADTRRVGEKQGLPKKDLHWRKLFLCGHELPPYSSGSHAHGFNSLFPPRLVVDILGHVDCGMSHVVPRYLWPDANTAHQA